MPNYLVKFEYNDDEVENADLEDNSVIILFIEALLLDAQKNLPFVKFKFQNISVTKID